MQWDRKQSDKNTYSAAIKVLVFDPAIKGSSPIFHQIAFDELDAHRVGESALGLRSGDQVFVFEVYLEVLTAFRRDESVGTPCASTYFCPDSVAEIEWLV